eukprot:TRINITY_DN2841_c0_g1_i1.p1 TRINITY_DN2841_c0_g1~~TRINITY_DN2841_c0_g1_i1.p1  ORF type:complete len:307 (-),score=56.37 TRINITY_DN2841_c0_g1_i1:72-992(-)
MTSQVATIDTKHVDMIHDAQLDYYGRRLATCSSDASIKIFEVSGDSQTHLANLSGHGGPVWQIAWAHPKFGNVLASCSYDRKVFIWKESSPNVWTKIYEYAKHELSVNSISWAPHEIGLSLVCGSSDSFISVLTHKGDNKWTELKFSAHNLGVSAVCWGPPYRPGSLLDPNAPPALIKRFVSGGCDNTVKVWTFIDLDKEPTSANLGEHKDWIRDVAWAPNLGLPKETIASCSQDGTVIIWTEDNEGWSKKALDEPTFTDVVWRVSWSVSGNILAVSSADNKVTLWKEDLNGNWKCINILQDQTAS